MVAGKDQSVFGIIAFDERQILIDRICRSAIPVLAALRLVRRKNGNAAARAVQIPRFAVADVLIQHKGLILCQNADSIDAGVHAVGHREVDDTVFTAERNRRFCRFLGKRIKTAALTACEKHCDTFFFLEHKNFLPFVFI